MFTLFHHPFCPHSRFIRLALGEHGLDLRLVEERVWERREGFLALNPACAEYDLETLVTDRNELAKPLYDLDDWLTEFRAAKLARDKRLMARMIEQAKSYQNGNV